jgi:aspartate carbamoyltransferase regulatory subunit
MKKDIRAFKVFAIADGTVIDHIPAGLALKIINLLNLAKYKKVVTVGLNFSSKKIGTKDIVKVENRELVEEEANLLAIFAPQASVNIIKNYEVVKKFKLSLPSKVKNLLVCPNPKCITNHESMSSCFSVQQEDSQVKLKCDYCERTFLQEDIKEYNIKN